jgi:hypothetical protein
MSTITTLPDDPITAEDQDLLGRTGFARAIADLVLNAPPGATLRIGVYGGWGEGKTSVLQLVQKRLEEERHVTVFLYAWASLNVQALFQRLVAEIAGKLGLSAGDLKGLQTLRKAVTPLGPLDSRIKGPITVLDSILGGLSSRATKVLVTKIPRALKGRKLIVFVDDIDRIRPTLVPDLLLSLREVLNLPDYFYIIALAPDVVQASLRASNKEWGDSTKFLEKIIELPRQLPSITDDDLGRFLEASCNRLGIDHAHRQFLLDLSTLLPRNPRQLKTFLRFVGSLGHLIARFDTEEVDWSAFYVAQLLRLEFPSESLRLTNDADAMRDLKRDILRDNRTKPDARSHPFERHAPPEGKERFNELCECLAGRPLIFGLYDLKILFYLLDEPPLITWKEIGSLIDCYSCTPETERLNLLARRAAESGERSKALKALYHRALEFRERALAAAIDCVTDDDLRERCDHIGIIDDVLLKLELDLHGVADGILRDDSLDALTTQCVKWAGIQDSPYFDKARVSERRLLGAFLDSMPDARLLELPAVMDRWAHRVEVSDANAPLKKLITEKAVEVRRRLARVLLTSFRDHVMLAERPTQFATDATNHAYRMVFYEPESPLLAEPELRAAFLRVLAESGAAIQENAIGFLASLVWGRRQDVLEASKFASIVGDREIMNATWLAAVRRPLQPLYAGHLQEVRKQLIEAQVPEDLFPLPRWLALERGDPRDQDPRQ